MKTEPIKQATWLYEGTSPVLVQIERTDMKPGSGDYQDPEDVREDMAGEFYRILYSAAGETEFRNERGYFDTLADAIEETKKAFPGIRIE